MGLPVQARAFAGKDPVLMPVMDNPSHLGTFITVMLNVFFFSTQICLVHQLLLSIVTSLYARQKSPLKLLFFPLYNSVEKVDD